MPSDSKRRKSREEIVLNNKHLSRMTSSAADRRRAREEYYRDHNSAHGSSDERVVGTVNLLSSSSSANNSVSSSHHNGGPTVLSHVTEGTTETSSRNSGGSGARSGGGSNNTSNNDPPEIGEDDHYYQEEPRSSNYNNNGYPSDSAEIDDDEPELRTLATMDTHTFRRLREERRKSKGSDTEGSTRSSTIRHRSQQRSDPRGINQRDKRVRYRGGGGGGHGRNSFDEDDHTDGGSNDSRSMMTDGVSRFSRATHRSNHRSNNNNNNMNRSHSSSPTSHQLQMFFIFALGLVLVIKAGIVEVKLEKAQLRGISERVRGGDGYSHLNHLSGDEYYKAPTVMNAEKDDERDVVEGHSPSEAYFNDAVDKLENGGGVYSQGEKEETEDGGEEQQAEQDLEEAEDEGEDILNENNPAGEQEQQQQSPLEFLQSQSQSSLTQDVNLQQQPDVQQQQLLEQSQFQSQLAWGNQQSGEQIQQPQQQNLFVQQQQPQQQSLFAQQQPQQQNQFGYQLNQAVQQQLPAHYQYGHQYGNQQHSFGQQQNQFDQQFNQQNYLQYGQQPQQLQPQYNQQQYNPQQNPQLPQQFEPQLQQDVKQEVFALQSSNEVVSPLDQLGNVGNANVNANSNELANLPDYAPVGNVDAIDTNTDLNNQQQYNPQQNLQLPQQVEPAQLQQDVQQNVQQEVFALQSSNEVGSPPDQLGNVFNAHVNANSNEAANLPDAIDAANAAPNNDQSGAEIDRNPVNEDSPAPLPPTDILNNRIVPFDVSRQPRFQGNRKADDQEEASEDVEDAPIQVQPDAYGTVKEAQPVQEKPRRRRPKPDPNNPDLNYKAAVVDDGIAFTNPRLWGAKTLTTPGLRNHLNKNDAKFAPAAAEVG